MGNHVDKRRSANRTRLADDLSATAGGLTNQAMDTAYTYFQEAIEEIDYAFGDGYAKAHPELVGAFMQTASMDYVGSIVGKTLQEGLADIAAAIRTASETD